MGQPRRHVVCYGLITAAVVYYLKQDGVLDSITAEHYVSNLRTPSLGLIDTAELVRRQKEGSFPSIGQMAPAVYLCALLGVLRVFLTDLVLVPLGRWAMALESRKSSKVIIDRWTESCWRCLLYTVSVGVGVWCLQGKSWVPIWGSTIDCWKGWPLIEITYEIQVFYCMAGGLYLHLFFFQWVDARRKDFFEMMSHHVCTILAISFSYLTNFTRFGTLVLMVHDPTDAMLEYAKIFNYIRTYRGGLTVGYLADLVFTLFSITFFVTRFLAYILGARASARARASYLIWVRHDGLVLHHAPP